VQRPLPHFARGLVGEGDSQRLRRPGKARGDDVGEPCCQHAGLARAGAGEHQQRAFRCHYGFTLFGVQPLKIGGIVAHGGRARRGHLADRETIRIGTHQEHIAGIGVLCRL